MMSVEANAKFCSNCVMHNWKQPVDKSVLKHCRGCGMIQYCSRVCRKEHWEKVHKNHCQFIADPSMCPESQHDAGSCDFCRPDALTGKGKQRMAGREGKRNQASSSYECIIKDRHFAPSLASPHPFPVAGMTNDLLEKSIVVAQKLVHKLKQNPRVSMVCSDEMEQMELFLWSIRKEIWRHRKIYSHPKIVYMIINFHQIKDLYENIRIKLSQGKAGKDALELSNILKLVNDIMAVVARYKMLETLKNPIDSMPDTFRDLVKQESDNKIEVLDIAKKFMDYLSTQVRPYEDVVKKLCGDKKRQNCSFCGVKIEVAKISGCKKQTNNKESFLFNSLSIRKFSCGSQDCQKKIFSIRDDMNQLNLAVTAACNECDGTRCDFCFKLCPLDEVHRCCICLTVMYCSKSCHKKDKEEHSNNYCIPDKRKTKEDRSMRIQMGEITPEKMAAMTVGSVIQNREDVLNETMKAFQFKYSKSKNRAGSEHDANIRAAETVPAAEDCRSELGNGATNTVNVNDRSTLGGEAANTEHAQGRSASGAEATGGPNINEVD